MPRPAHPVATWLAVFALLVQSAAFALHGPLRVLAGADGGLVICTAEGLKRLGTPEPNQSPRSVDHACTACVTLASPAIPPSTPPAAGIVYASAVKSVAAFHPIFAVRPASGPGLPRAPPLAV